jgi:hypothetical protein
LYLSGAKEANNIILGSKEDYEWCKNLLLKWNNSRRHLIQKNQLKN